MKITALLLIFAISALSATSHASPGMTKLPCGKFIETKGQSLHSDRTAFYPASKSLAKQNGPGVRARN
ncbi:MAG: hypothetical protein AABY53_05365 [Bdellovibrionota bacterium]